MKAITLGRSVVCVAWIVGLSGCCSIIHGTRQDVGVSSTPTGALVKIDNAPSGNTPLVAKLTRKDNHIVHVELPGYQPFDMTLTRSVSGWVWGNIVFGGLIGLAIDAIDGAFYNLSPEQVSAALAASHASVANAKDGVYLFAVLKPEPGWAKVGQLQATQ